MPRPWTLIESVPTDEGPLELRQRAEKDFMITIAGRVLMNSLQSRSEVALGEAACAPIAGKPRPRVLIGGLGMGITLRAALDTLPPGAQVTVVELNPAVERWCRGPLAPVNRDALEDPRVQVLIEDVGVVLTRSPGVNLDAIMLDLYEGADDPTYSEVSLALAHAALTKNGILAIWSEDTDPRFERRMRRTGFRTEKLRPGKGRRHAVYLGRKTEPR